MGPTLGYFLLFTNESIDPRSMKPPSFPQTKKSRRSLVYWLTPWRFERADSNRCRRFLWEQKLYIYSSSFWNFQVVSLGDFVESSCVKTSGDVWVFLISRPRVRWWIFVVFWETLNKKNLKTNSGSMANNTKKSSESLGPPEIPLPISNHHVFF